MEKDFQSWCTKKVRLNALPESRIVYFRQKELWWCALGANIGFEQDGKNELFERPVLILRKINRYLALVVPLSTKIKKHPYYFGYQYGNTSYSALILQMRVVSSKRFLRRIGMLNTTTFKQITEQSSHFVNGL